MRRLAAAVVPEPAKRVHERWSERRRLNALRGPTDTFVDRYGTTVRNGPVAGLRYPNTDMPGDMVAKLVGMYELQIHDALRTWEAADTIIDVGCAEGYWAVGLAVAFPRVTVHAYDLEPRQRERCAAMAELNGVSDRVRVRGACTPQTLNDFPADGVALLSDCEGYELTLLDPVLAPVLRNWSVVVELHDFIDPQTTETIVRRFEPTHDVQVIPEVPRPRVPELAGLPADLLLDEYRPGPMNFAFMTPLR